MLKLKILNESDGNFLSSLIGMGLAFDKTIGGLEIGTDIFLNEHGLLNELFYRMLERAKKMAFKGKGHNKFLRGIHLDIIVQAPCDWWQEMSTYTTVDCMQSTSTMHMLKKSKLEGGIDPLADEIILNRYREMLNETDDLVKLKRNLPAWYLYTRTIHLNYMTLQNIYNQRKKHKLPEWQIFCDEVLKQVKHPYFIQRDKLKIDKVEELV